MTTHASAGPPGGRVAGRASPAFRSMALGIMLSVVAVLAATLTLLPAVLGKLGTRVDTGRIRSRRKSTHPHGQRLDLRLLTWAAYCGATLPSPQPPVWPYSSWPPPR